jgi:hypothetical protein
VEKVGTPGEGKKIPHGTKFPIKFPA